MLKTVSNNDPICAIKQVSLFYF